MFVAGEDPGLPQGKQNFARLVDIKSGKILRELPCPNWPNGGRAPRPALSPDGKFAFLYVCVPSSVKKPGLPIMVFDTKTGKKKGEFRGRGRGHLSVFAYAISPDNTKLAMVARYSSDKKLTHTLQVIDLKKGKILRYMVCPGVERFVSCGKILFSPDSRYLFVGTEWKRPNKATQFNIALIGV